MRTRVSLPCPGSFPLARSAPAFRPMTVTPNCPKIPSSNILPTASTAKREKSSTEQGSTAASIFAGRTTAAAWHSKPSWYAVSKLDKTINPDLERFLAKRMNANTVELEAGHLSMVSHPKEVADLILAAAGQKK